MKVQAVGNSDCGIELLYQAVLSGAIRKVEYFFW